MDLAWLPFLLFPAVAAVSALIAMRRWRARQSFARAAGVLSLAALALFAFEFVQLNAGNAIRVDLLATIPAIAAGALALGIGVRRQQAVLGVALGAIGAASLGWFGWTMAGAARENVRLTGIYDESNRLYWEETLLCDRNFALRFGDHDAGDHACRGHFLATPAANSYPFTRVVVNNMDQAFFLFSPNTDVETNFTLDDGPLADVALEGTTLRGACRDLSRCREVTLQPLEGGGCEAFVAQPSRVSRLTLRPASLPSCPVAPPSVRLVGIFGRMFSTASTPPLRQLVQVWLWESATQARAIVLVAEGYPGNTTPFNFVRPFVGAATAPGVWTLEEIDLQGESTGQRLTITSGQDEISLAGAIRFRTNEGSTLPRQSLVDHPKLALVPLRDEAAFTRYFDNVLHNLNVPWTAP